MSWWWRGQIISLLARVFIDFLSAVSLGPFLVLGGSRCLLLKAIMLTNCGRTLDSFWERGELAAIIDFHLLALDMGHSIIFDCVDGLFDVHFKVTNAYRFDDFLYFNCAKAFVEILFVIIMILLWNTNLFFIIIILLILLILLLLLSQCLFLLRQGRRLFILHATTILSHNIIVPSLSQSFALHLVQLLTLQVLIYNSIDR